MSRRLVLALVLAATSTATTSPGSAAAPSYRRISGTTFQQSDVKVSGNGRYVVFVAHPRAYGVGVAEGTVPPPAPQPPGNAYGQDDVSQVYLTDLKTGTMELVSVSVRGTPGNGNSNSPSISADGRYVVFSSLADNLVNGDTNRQNAAGEDVFLRDRKTRRTTRVSLDAKGRELVLAVSRYPAISADGSTITYYSDGNVLASSHYGCERDPQSAALFVVPRTGPPGKVKLVSQLPDGSTIWRAIFYQGGAPAAMSATGRYVAGFVGGNGFCPLAGYDGVRVYVRDLRSRKMWISPASPPYVTESSSQSVPMGRMTLDMSGTKVLFEEAATAGLYVSRHRLLLWNVRTGRVEQVDGAATTLSDATGTSGDKTDPVLAYATQPVMSSDGRYVVFTRSDGRSLPPFVGPYEPFPFDYTGATVVTSARMPRRVVKRDLVTGTTTELVLCAPLSPDQCPYTSFSPGISGNGSVVAFVTSGTLDSATDPDDTGKANQDPNRAQYPYDVYVVS